MSNPLLWLAIIVSYFVLVKLMSIILGGTGESAGADVADDDREQLEVENVRSDRVGEVSGARPGTRVRLRAAVREPGVQARHGVPNRRLPWLADPGASGDRHQ